MSDYPHRLRVFRGGASPGGSQNDDGVWVDNPAVEDDNTIYDDAADVQDAGKSLERDNMGSPSGPSNAIVFLRNEKKVGEIRPGDKVEITWEDGKKDQAEVSRIRRLDGSILLRYV